MAADVRTFFLSPYDFELRHLIFIELLSSDLGRGEEDRAIELVLGKGGGVGGGAIKLGLGIGERRSYRMYCFVLSTEFGLFRCVHASL